MKLFALALALLVSACGHTPKSTQKVESIIPDVRKVSIDKTLLVSCKPIPQIKGSTELELLTWISEWKIVYIECKSSNDALIHSITSAFPNSK